MSDFNPRSLGPGHLLIGLGVFVIAAVVGLEWIEGGFVRGTEKERSLADLRYLLADDEVKILELEAQLEMEEAELANRQERHREVMAIQKAQENRNKAAAGLVVVRDEINELREKLAAREREMRSYRATMRKRVWAGFVGRKLDKKHVRRDLRYRDPVIKSVDETGLTVRHRSGVARVTVAQLSSAFRETLDLSLEEARRTRAQEARSESRARPEKGRQDEPKSEEGRTTGESQPARLVAARKRVAQLRELIREADRQAAEARHHDRQSKNRSVPGSLETWQQRAQRLARKALSYRNQLAELELLLDQPEKE